MKLFRGYAEAIRAFIDGHPINVISNYAQINIFLFFRFY